MPTPTRSQLKKDFFSGQITVKEFKKGIKEALRYRGYHMKPGKRPKWSGPFHDTRAEAEADNAPYFDAGYSVEVYTEQA